MFLQQMMVIIYGNYSFSEFSSKKKREVGSAMRSNPNYCGGGNSCGFMKS